jgi:hypothetical protein
VCTVDQVGLSKLAPKCTLEHPKVYIKEINRYVTSNLITTIHFRKPVHDSVIDHGGGGHTSYRLSFAIT